MHGHDRRPSTAIAIELSNLIEILNVHIAQVKIPITLHSIHDADHHDYHVVSENWLYDFLKLSKPIFLIHRDFTRPIRTPVTFKLGWFQHFKLRWIVNGQYLARIVTFQNDTMIPLSRLQVCNQSLPIAPPYLSVTTVASCPLRATSSSGLYPTHAIYHQAEPEHNVPNSEILLLLISNHQSQYKHLWDHLNNTVAWTPWFTILSTEIL